MARIRRRWGSIVLGVALVLFWAALPVLGQEPPQADITEIDRLVAEGKKLYQQGRFVDAITSFQQALERVRAAYPPARYPQGLEKLSHVLNELGNASREAGKMDQARSAIEESLAIERRLFPAERHPNGHSNIAVTLSNLAFTEQKAGRLERAKTLYEESLAMQRKLSPDGTKELAETLSGFAQTLYALGQLDPAAASTDEALVLQRKLFPTEKHPNGHIDIATSLSVRGLIEYSRGKPAQSLPYFEEALAMNRKLYSLEKYPTGHPNLATAINNVAAMHQVLGRLAFALPLHEETLAMRRRQYPEKQYPRGHADIVQSLHNLGALTVDMRQFPRAIAYAEEAVAMAARLFPKEQFPDGHQSQSAALLFLAVAYDEAGQSVKALAPGEQALEMFRAQFPESRFPNGHPQLERAMFSVGVAYSHAGQPERGLALVERAVAMARKLYSPEKYPNGHPELANVLNGVGHMYSRLRREDESIDAYRQALTMREKLFPRDRFPNGHPDLAIGYGNVGLCLLNKSKIDEAAPFLEKSLSLLEQLYPERPFPDGHTDLIRGIYHRGAIELHRDRPDLALPYLSRAAAMRSRYLAANIPLVAEAQAVQLMTRMSPTQNAYLSCTRLAKTPAPEAYTEVWASKAMLSRVLERRHLAARVARGTDPQVAKQWEQLAEVRQEIARVINRPQRSLAARDAYLKDLNDRRQELERSLVAALPNLTLPSDRTPTRPGDLQAALPDGAVFLDIISFDDYKPRGRRYYAVFILAKGRPIARVDLADADLIDRATDDWLAAIQRREDRPAKELRERVWTPLRPHLPANTRTVFVCADGGLNNVPWAALPGDAPGSVLLDQYAFAAVPHASFLAEQLKKAASSAPSQTSLLVGGLDYGATQWPTLSGTAKELDTISKLAPRPPVQLTGTAGSADRLRRELPNARLVHLATHGFFAEKDYVRDVRRTQEMLAQIGTTDFDQAVASGAAAQSRLAYTGLVLSAGDVITGEHLVDLALDQLDLCVLSACESGQGTTSEGEGVFGLTRAFHLAGCPNVVASLWKVNDAATAALMAKFYHEMWVNKKPPIEALREAQLTIYRNPDRIPDLAGERGTVRVKEAVNAKSTVANASGSEKRADTKLWAAFVLSGLGK